MKKSVLFFVRTVLVLGLVFAAGCGEEEENGGGGTVPDPAGTITVSMSNNGIKNTYVPIERGEGVAFHAQHNGHGWHEWMAININNNLIVQSGVIANLGKVNGLGSITKAPASGYTSQTSVEINHGYVIRLECGDYVRVYVVEWRKNTSGGIIGAKVKYQHPWNP